MRSATCSVMSATSRCETSPISANSAVARSGSSVCRWTLSVWLSPTTSTESPNRSSGSFQADRVQVLAGDREVRAVAERRRLVLRVRDARRRVVGELRRRGAAQRGDHAGEHHGQAVAAGVDDAGLAQDRQQLGTARDRQLAGAQRRLEHRRRSSRSARRRRRGDAAAARPCARRSDATRAAISRTTVRIVPSAGSRTEPYARSAARAIAAATSTGSISSPGREISSSAAPRSSWERITPELPRAPSSAARATESTISSRPMSSMSPCARQAVELVEHGAQRERHVVARVAVGDREHVEVVDLPPARLELGERALDDGAEADETGIGHAGFRPARRGRPAARPW